MPIAQKLAVLAIFRKSKAAHRHLAMRQPHPFGLTNVRTFNDGRSMFEGKLPDDKFQRMHKTLLAKGLTRSRVADTTGNHQQYSSLDQSELVQAKHTPNTGLNSPVWDVIHVVKI